MEKEGKESKVIYKSQLISNGLLASSILPKNKQKIQKIQPNSTMQ